MHEYLIEYEAPFRGTIKRIIEAESTIQLITIARELGIEFFNIIAKDEEVQLELILT